MRDGFIQVYRFIINRVTKEKLLHYLIYMHFIILKICRNGGGGGCSTSDLTRPVVVALGCTCKIFLIPPTHMGPLLPKIKTTWVTTKIKKKKGYELKLKYISQLRSNLYVWVLLFAIISVFFILTAKFPKPKDGKSSKKKI